MQKKINQTAETANFTDFPLISCRNGPYWTKTMQTQTLCSLLQNYFWVIQGMPYERWHPGVSENVMVLIFLTGFSTPPLLDCQPDVVLFHLLLADLLHILGQDTIGGGRDDDNSLPHCCPSFLFSPLFSFIFPSLGILLVYQYQLVHPLLPWPSFHDLLQHVWWLYDGTFDCIPIFSSSSVKVGRATWESCHCHVSQCWSLCFARQCRPFHHKKENQPQFLEG